MVLKLTENGKPTDPEEDWGTLECCCTLLPKTLAEREQVNASLFDQTIQIAFLRLVSNFQTFSTVLQQRLSPMDGQQEAQNARI